MINDTEFMFFKGDQLNPLITLKGEDHVFVQVINIETNMFNIHKN